MSGPTVDAEILRLVRARLPRRNTAADVKEALEALQAAEQLAALPYAHKALVGVATVEASLYRVSQDLRILARAADGDSGEEADTHRALTRAAEQIEALADLARLLDVATAVSLDALEEAEAEAAE